MNSKERVLTTFKHKEPDRVPISDQLIVSKVASEILGRHAYTGGGEFERDSIELLLKGERYFLVNRYIEDTLELHQKLDLDFIVVYPVPPKDIDPKSLPKKIAPNTYRYEDNETGSFTIAKFDESSGLFFPVDSTYKREGMGAIEKDIAVFEKKLEEPVEVDSTIFEGANGIIARAGKERAIGFAGRFGLAIPPATHWLEAVLLKPEWVEIYLDYQLQQAIAHLEEVKDKGDFFRSEGDLADNRGPLYSPAIFQNMVVPRYKKLVDLAHSYSLYYIYSTDGNTRPLGKMLFDEIGVDGYMEIDVEAGMDIGEMKKAYGNKITLLGNVDCAKTLIYGTKEEIFNEVKTCIQKAARGGGYILTSSNSIHYNVPAKNFLYMVEAGRKFGKYPISL